MGIWAAVKYALNSTLGTTGFKSLDKLIEDRVNEIKNQRQASLTGSGVTLFSKDAQSRVSWELSYPIVLAKFIAPIDGIYALTLDASFYYSIWKSGDVSPSLSYDGTNYQHNGRYDPYYVYDKSSVGTVMTAMERVTYGTTNSKGYTLTYTLDQSKDYALFTGAQLIAKDVSKNSPKYFRCKAGEPVVLIGVSLGSTGSTTISIPSVTVTYQPR